MKLKNNKMEFPDPGSDCGLKFLDDFLSSRSYVTGFEATANDVIVFKALKGCFAMKTSGLVKSPLE